MKKKMSKVSALHYLRLVYRSLLLMTLLVWNVCTRVTTGSVSVAKLEQWPLILSVIWIVFAVEMVFRFFPSELESPGCQKQFARNYIKSGSTEIVTHDNNAVVLVALIWIVFNGVFGALHMVGVFDDGIMILLCGAYSVCDMICILFFCPFQSWFLKNKCCSACRIYNWDYAMMFTPLFFVRSKYSWSLLALSVALLFRWEITYFRHPERFSEETNEYLRCKNCTEKLCSHKRQLHSLWKRIETETALRIKRLSKHG